MIVDPKSTGKVEVTLIATGFSNNYSAEEIMDIPRDFDISKNPLAALVSKTPEPMIGDESIFELLLEDEGK